jgi:hypothetical protein
MNQGIAFARTLRALDADDFRRSKLSLALAAILLGAWVWWMLAARVPQYETTTNVQIEDGRAIAYFPSTSELRQGESALVIIGSVTIPAQVGAVYSDHAELVFTSHQLPATPSMPATAEVEVSRISPAAIALRTLGASSR